MVLEILREGRNEIAQAHRSHVHEGDACGIDYGNGCKGCAASIS
jgi:hypothetical protein